MLFSVKESVNILPRLLGRIARRDTLKVLDRTIPTALALFPWLKHCIKTQSCL